jgi:hypothetical protein
MPQALAFMTRECGKKAAFLPGKTATYQNVHFLASHNAEEPKEVERMQAQH